MEFTLLAPNGPCVMTPVVHGDERGFFMETFRQNEFEANVGPWYSFVQDNHSKSRQGVLRGLHYQLHSPQGKLVRVMQGTVFDVAVDLRQSSPSFGKSFGVTLDDQKHQMLWVPPGFAHGFLVLSETAEFVYKCTTYYAPDDEYSLRYDDPTAGIDWPALPNGLKPQTSAKDEAGMSWEQCPKFS